MSGLRRLDLTGQKFGRLTVTSFGGRDRNRNLQWGCQCDCGQQKVILQSSLTSGRTRSCGCLQRKPLRDLYGKRFNRLTVLSYVRQDKKANRYWLCRCDCGKEKVISQGNLLAGNVGSCGCLKHFPVPGERFGRLTVLERVGKNKSGRSLFLCTCDCGNQKTVDGSRLTSGKVRSCRCLQSELSRNRAKTHGMKNTPVYRVWTGMIQRCINPKMQTYKNYGGRGIKVCDRWRNSFEAFFADMGPPPGKGWSIERNDVYGNYEPQNCEWILKERQARNTRRTIRYNVGERIGQMTVLSTPIWGITDRVAYFSRCDCGVERLVCAREIKKGRDVCGCTGRQLARILQSLRKLFGDGQKAYPNLINSV